VKLAKLKASIGVAVATLVGYSTTWAQFQCDNPLNGDCNSTGIIRDDPQLAAPAVLALIAVGIVGAIMMAKRK